VIRVAAITGATSHVTTLTTRLRLNARCSTTGPSLVARVPRLPTLRDTRPPTPSTRSMWRYSSSHKGCPATDKLYRLHRTRPTLPADCSTHPAAASATREWTSKPREQRYALTSFFLLSLPSLSFPRAHTDSASGVHFPAVCVVQQLLEPRALHALAQIPSPAARAVLAARRRLEFIALVLSPSFITSRKCFYVIQM
jgi:hypothetical protein